MATKTVTLKDSNGDTLYPVTDSNVVNINQQKTLAQALDGVVYAEDPTQNATPTAWVTNSDVDWTTIVTNLYETQNGTNATFQLSESAANFKRLRFFFKSNDGDYSSLDVYEPDGKIFSTVILHPVSGVIYIKNTLWSISGSTITMGKAVQGMLGNTTSVSDASYIYIMRVEGWKI